ncbi:MAG: glutathione S-transferase family protein [Gammaproteobacteria bacterium]|nr:glutathione S-transferase family protein [Gammaproteobacteria bacterium]
MIKLYGMTYSNYYNMVKAVLIEQAMDFEEVDVRPNQEPGFLQKSPMGKVPFIETDAGFLTEAAVIIDYIDAVGDGPSFYPEDPFARAKVQELMRHLELYIELPARRLYAEVFFGKPASDSEKLAVKALLEKGFRALGKLAKFNPYIAGEQITYADFYFRFSVSLATVVCRKAFGWDAYREVPHIKQLLDLLDQRESIKRVQADQARSA